MSKRILHVVTNVSQYEGSNHPTGLWLSELTHAWGIFENRGFEQTLVSPRGGVSPLEPRSLGWPNLDATAKAWQNDPLRMELLNNTQAPDQINGGDYDAIFFTGGHAVMYDFLNDEGLIRLTRDVWESGGVVSSVCHGYCGLLNITLTDGSRLISGRELTGFSWVEEVLAGVAKKVPYNAEQLAKDNGARYHKCMLPFVSHVVVDGRLVTGQNPQSAKATAQRVAELL